MKKLFALFAVAALAAVGCDDKKSTPGGTKTNATTGGTYAQTNRAVVDTTARVTNTVVVGTETGVRVNTVVGTATVTRTDPKGPTGLDKGGKDKER